MRFKERFCDTAELYESINDVEEDLIVYNANANNKHTGDCARRSISLAYNKPYTDVRRDLFAFAKRLGLPNDNSRVVVKYVDNLPHVDKQQYDINSHYKVEQFSQDHPTGTYLIHCASDRSQKSEHLVCVRDGDIYDSWDSRYMNVKTVWTVKQESDIKRNEENINLGEYIINKSTELLNQLKLDGSKPIIAGAKDNLTYAIEYRVPLTESEDKMWEYIWEHQIGHENKYEIYKAKSDPTDRRYFWSKKYYIKFTPFDNQEEKERKCDSICTTAFKDIISKSNRLHKDYYRITGADASMNPKFHGNKDVLAKMPKEAIPYIIGLYRDVDKEDGYTYTDYTLYMEHMPNDTNKDEYVAHASKLTTLKRYVKDYITTLDRNTEW